MLKDKIHSDEFQSDHKQNQKTSQESENSHLQK